MHKYLIFLTILLVFVTYKINNFKTTTVSKGITSVIWKSEESLIIDKGSKDGVEEGDIGSAEINR